MGSELGGRVKLLFAALLALLLAINGLNVVNSFAAPRYAVLDRPETVLGTETVARALELLANLGISIVTFSSAPALADLHDSRIVLAAGGSWSFEPLRPANATT